MYRYDEFDHDFVQARVAEFSDQVQRRLSGEISEDQFRPLRLMNGVYLQLHAYMLRIAVPYGTLNGKQLRMLGHIARKYDKGYGHFTTRQNIQFNWPALSDIPAILADLASVEMHAIQTSGNCIRNVTADHFAGAAADEVADPRPYAEILRQWSSVHPEFSFLPRKFKIAVTGAERDRAAIQTHDIGLHLKKNAAGELGFAVYVGGGQGRTPMVARKIRDFLPEADLLSYCTAILRVYNLYGRRDNKYKARIKILVKELTPARFAADVEAEWAHLKGGPAVVPDEEFARLEGAFLPPEYETLAASDAGFERKKIEDRAFARWVAQNTFGHKVPGYRAVTLSLKPYGGIPPGDATAEQIDAVADLADRYSFGEVRVSHEQNLILADVRQSDLYEVWQAAKQLGFATPNIGLLTNIIACPGGDFCSLANARSLPVAAAIQERFEDLDYVHDLGPIDLNISGCINACGHHHVGHIGILGVDKDNQEFYQVTLGGAQGNNAALGKVIGPSFSAAEIAPAVERIIEAFVDHRLDDESFIDTLRRVGPEPFKSRAYGKPELEVA